MPKRYASATAALPEPPLGMAPPLGTPPEPPIPHLRLDGLAKRAKLLKKSPAGPHLRDILPRAKHGTTHGPASAVSRAPITRKMAEREHARDLAEAQRPAQPGIVTQTASAAAQGAAGAGAERAINTAKLRRSGQTAPLQEKPPEDADALGHAPKQERPKQERPKRGRPLGADVPPTPGAQPMQPARAPDTGTRAAAHPVPQAARPEPITMQAQGRMGTRQARKASKAIVLQGRDRRAPRDRKARGGKLGGETAKAPEAAQQIPTQEEYRAHKEAQHRKVLEREREQQRADAKSYRKKALPKLAAQADARADEITHQLEPATAPMTPAPAPAPAKAPPTPQTERSMEAAAREPEGMLRAGVRELERGNTEKAHGFFRRFRKAVQRERLEQSLEGAEGTAEQLRGPRKRQGFKAEKPREKPTEQKAPRSQLDQVASKQGLARDSASDLRSRLAAAEASAKDRGMTKDGRAYYRREAAKIRKRLRAMEREA